MPENEGSDPGFPMLYGPESKSVFFAGTLWGVLWRTIKRNTTLRVPNLI